MENVYLVLIPISLAAVLFMIGLAVLALRGRKYKKALCLTRGRQNLLRRYCVSKNGAERNLVLTLVKNILASQKEFGFSWDEIGITRSQIKRFLTWAKEGPEARRSDSIRKKHARFYVGQRDRRDLDPGDLDIVIDVADLEEFTKVSPTTDDDDNCEIIIIDDDGQDDEEFVIDEESIEVTETVQPPSVIPVALPIGLTRSFEDDIELMLAAVGT